MIMKFAVYGDLFCNQPFYRLTWVNVLFALEKKEKHSVGKKKRSINVTENNLVGTFFKFSQGLLTTFINY